MPIQYVRPDIPAALRDPFDCDEQAVKALATAGAFAALADGRVEAVERDAAVEYIERCQIAPTMSKARIVEFFDERAHRLQDADFADLIVEVLRPVACLSLTADATRIAEEVAASDRHLHPNEMQVISFIRLITMSLREPR
jgi:tellurite resistance protein TerB